MKAMEHRNLREQKWFANAVAACIAVTLYVLLTHLDTVGDALSTFIGYFRAVILGCVLAYLMNPLAMWYHRHIQKRIKKEALCWTISTVLALVSVLLILCALLGVLIPQLAESVWTLADNFDDYAASLQNLMDSSGIELPKWILNPDQLSSMSDNIMKTIHGFVADNASRVLSATASAGKGIFTWMIAFILSVYLLLAKSSAKAGVSRLLKAILRSKRAGKVEDFFRRCDSILVSFVVDSLLESLIVGTLNCVFMLICGMQYAGLISVVVGATNLIPTFGPIIGGIVGAFVLLLVNPVHAGVFILFTFALQFVDGYVVKPKLFGNSLGVSGLLILIAGIVGGNMFGFIGVLLAIPGAAILNFIYHDYLLPMLERRQH